MAASIRFAPYLASIFTGPILSQSSADFIGVHMVTFVREAIGRVRRVYERLVALAATAEPANGTAAAAEANADRNAAAADAA